MEKFKLILIFCIFFALNLHAQKNILHLKVKLDTLSHQLDISQKITFYNTSSDTLNKVYFHNWANSFKDNKTPLAKRFIENGKKKFHFSDKEKRGYSKINTILVNNIPTIVKELKDQPDIIAIQLPEPIKANDSVVISANYTVKLPNAKFTGYGKTKNGYHIRYWYLTPAVYHNNEWQTMSNLNIDDLFENVADFTIDLNVPENYHVESN